MGATQGTGQGSGGKGLLVTAVTAGTAQTLHTVGAAPQAQIFRAMLVNNGTSAVVVTLRFEPADASDPVEIQETVPAQSGAFTDIPDTLGLPLNVGMVVKIYADTASAVTAWAGISQEQQDLNGRVEILQTGEITLVQNTDAFRMNGVASSAVEADHQIMVPLAGVLYTLKARATAAVGGGATATVTVRVNGANTGIAVTIANAQGVAVQTDDDVVPVAAGDLVCINAATDNVGAPASTVLASIRYLPAA